MIPKWYSKDTSNFIPGCFKKLERIDKIWKGKIAVCMARMKIACSSRIRDHNCERFKWKVMGKWEPIPILITRNFLYVTLQISRSKFSVLESTALMHPSLSVLNCWTLVESYIFECTLSHIQTHCMIRIEILNKVAAPTQILPWPHFFSEINSLELRIRHFKCNEWKSVWVNLGRYRYQKGLCYIVNFRSCILFILFHLPSIAKRSEVRGAQPNSTFSRQVWCCLLLGDFTSSFHREIHKWGRKTTNFWSDHSNFGNICYSPSLALPDCTFLIQAL